MENNVKMIDPLTIANAFNKYFTDVGTYLAKEIPDVQRSPKDYLKTPSSNSFYIFPVSKMKLKLKLPTLNLESPLAL